MKFLGLQGYVLPQPLGEEISKFDSPGQANNIAVDDNTIFLADGEAGIRMINFENPAVLREISHLETHDYTYDVAKWGDYLYTADGSSGLRVVEISDPANPIEVSHYDTPGDARAIDKLKEVAEKDNYPALRSIAEEAIRSIEQKNTLR